MEKYLQIGANIFNCKFCPTPCDQLSKLNYSFENDVQFSAHFENKIINFINAQKSFQAIKSTEPGYPDIKVLAEDNSVFYIEVKVQRRTFMQIEHVLPLSKLKPSETVALNVSDLTRYIKLMKEHNMVIVVCWVLIDRPCILNDNTAQFYYSLLKDLSVLYDKTKAVRKFKRKSGTGDVINGLHKGVTLNFHFSLNELKMWESPQSFFANNIM